MNDFDYVGRIRRTLVSFFFSLFFYFLLQNAKIRHQQGRRTKPYDILKLIFPSPLAHRGEQVNALASLHLTLLSVQYGV